MAFYSFPLAHAAARAATRAASDRCPLEKAVWRLTGEIGDWLGVDAGHLRVGDRADVVVVDPTALDERLDAYHEAPMEGFGGLVRMVNRSDGAVRRGARRRARRVRRRRRARTRGARAVPARGRRRSRRAPASARARADARSRAARRPNGARRRSASCSTRRPRSLIESATRARACSSWRRARACRSAGSSGTSRRARRSWSPSAEDVSAPDPRAATRRVRVARAAWRIPLVLALRLLRDTMPLAHQPGVVRARPRVPHRPRAEEGARAGRQALRSSEIERPRARAPARARRGARRSTSRSWSTRSSPIFDGEQLHRLVHASPEIEAARIDALAGVAKFLASRASR